MCRLRSSRYFHSQKLFVAYLLRSYLGSRRRQLYTDTAMTTTMQMTFGLYSFVLFCSVSSEGFYDRRRSYLERDTNSRFSACRKSKSSALCRLEWVAEVKWCTWLAGECTPSAHNMPNARQNIIKEQTKGRNSNWRHLQVRVVRA